MRRLSGISAALAAPLFLAGQALADFNYTTAISPTPPGNAPLTFGTFSSVEVDPFNTAGTQSTGLGSVGITIATTTVDDTAPTPGDEGPVTPTVTDTITILPTTGGSGVLTLIGTLSVETTATDNGLGGVNYGQLTSFTPTGGVTSVVIGGLTYSYTFASVHYSQGTVNGIDAGALSLVVTVVPEPASMALVGVGGLLLAAPRLRRLARRNAS